MIKTGADAIMALVRDATVEYIEKHGHRPTVVMIHPESIHRIMAQEHADMAIIMHPHSIEGMTIMQDHTFVDTKSVAVFKPVIKTLSKQKIKELGL